MSAPFPSVACTGCEQQLYVSETIGPWFWRDAQGRACVMRQEPGYCRSCAALSFIGLAPPDHDARRQRSWFYWLDDSRRDSSHYFGEVSADLLPLISCFALRFRIRRLHRGLCLICGSSEVAAIRIPRRFPYRGNACWDTGLSHDGCGGHIVIRGADHVRSWPEGECRIFDLAGRQVFGVPLHPPGEPRPEGEGYVVLTLQELIGRAMGGAGAKALDDAPQG